jgi:DNA-binding transcriptional LysR family regulator
MNMSQLNALVAIADEGSFSGAADALATVQSNVSTHLKKLERELGTVLVDRTNGQLTPAGELVAARARRARAELDAAVSDVLALQHDVAGTVRIGIIGTTARWLVPDLLDVVPERYPRLRLVFVESTTTALESQVTAGSVDLAILNLPHASPELLLTPLFEEELVLVTSLDHPLADAGEISVRELDGIPILVPHQGTAFRDDLDDAVAPLGVTLVPRAEVDGTRLIASLTFEGYGPAILPSTALPRYLRDQWATVGIREIPHRVVGVARHVRSVPSAPTRAVLDLLTEIVLDPSLTPEGLRPVPPTAGSDPGAETRRRLRTDPPVAGHSPGPAPATSATA